MTYSKRTREDRSRQPRTPSQNTSERRGESPRSNPPQERRERRALTHVGGEVTLSLDREMAALLAPALDVPSSVDEGGEALAREHVHGFHSYPARMHPFTARKLIEALSPKEGVVLDPFCGSGTVVVEAALAGRRAFGSDLNPLAVEITRAKVTPTNEAFRRSFLEASGRVNAVATERRKMRAGASRRYTREDTSTFDMHVLFELDGLRVGIEAEQDVRTRRILLLVLSSILVKLSRRTADTALQERQTRIAAGFASRMFTRRAEELSRQWSEVEALLAAAPPAKIAEEDARELTTFESGSVDLVLTSPPYAGVYDYLEHHALRLRWLGLDERRFAKGEIGARRNLSNPNTQSTQNPAALFRGETLGMLRAMARVLRPGGKAVLLVADGLIQGRALRIDELLTEVAPEVGLKAVGIASQERPHFHGPTLAAFRSAPRREHAVMLAAPKAP
jgi:DNA modification methylase